MSLVIAQTAVPSSRIPVTVRVMPDRGAYPIPVGTILNFADARSLADALVYGAVEVGAQWSARKASILELHTLCRGLIDERERVAKRLTRHARILKSLLCLSDVHEAIVAAIARDLPDVEPASIRQRLAALIHVMLTAMGEIKIGGGR
jgi:hypothetical protein